VAFIRARLDALDRLYRGVLDWSLGHQKTVVGLAVLTFFSSFSVLAVMGTDFFPKPDRGQTTVLVTMPAGTSLAATTKVVGEVESILKADKDVLLVYSTVGVNGEARKASVRVNATQKTERERSQPEMMADIREQLARIPGARFSIQVAGIIEGEADFRQSPVTINVRGADFAVLLPIAEKVGAIVERTRGITDQDSTWAPGQPELRARIDRDAASAIGLSAAQTGLLIRSAIVGETPTRLRDGEDDIDIRVRLQPSDRSDLAAFESLLIPTRSGLAPLRQVATVERGSGPSTIEREDRQRQITVTANVAGRALGDVVNDIEAEMEEIDVPPGYTVKFAGEAERMRESMAALGVALLLAVVFIYVVLASQFESFVHPVTIMVSLPLAIVGALLGLFLSGYTIGMSSFIGIILLMGLVTKNAILLVDLANVLRDEQGLSIRDALLVAGPQRLRPIVMTSVAMVIGMMPTALSNGPGSEFRAPMAIAVIGGVITSTVLTLVVVPVAYTWLDRLTGRHQHARPAQAPPTTASGDDEMSLSAAEGK
jgi:multidrug efflux pump subunit AcrB